MNCAGTSAVEFLRDDTGGVPMVLRKIRNRETCVRFVRNKNPKEHNMQAQAHVPCTV